MKRLTLIVLMAFSAVYLFPVEPPKATKLPYFNADRAPEDCQFKGQSLDRVKVKFTDPANATFKVRQVEQGEDLTVRYITNSYHSNRCGQWQIVDTEVPDFTVAVVEYNEDFTVRITDEE